jgi:hypothetical protein
MPAHPHDTVGKGWCHGKLSTPWRQRSYTVFAKQHRGEQGKGWLTKGSVFETHHDLHGSVCRRGLSCLSVGTVLRTS